MTTPDSSAELHLIVSSLERIRRRLFLMRIVERLAIAILFGALVAIFILAARLLRESATPWFNGASISVAALPLLIAAWLWFRTPRINDAVLNPTLIRFAALITALLSLAAIPIFATAAWHALPLWSLPTACVAAFALAAAASVRFVDTRTAAIFVDQQIGLKERVSTALEFISSAPVSPLEASFRKPLIESALAACTTVRTAPVGYARLDRRVYALSFSAVLATIAAAFGVSLLLPMLAHAGRNTQQIVIVEKATDALAKKIKEIENKKSTPDADNANKPLESLKIAVQDIRRENMNSIEAEARLAGARGDLQKDADALDAAGKVEQALDAVKDLDPFNRAAKDLAQSDLKAADGSSAAAQAKADAQQKMDAAAKSLGDKLGQMSPAAQKGLASKLKDAADKAKGDPQLQKSLDRASKDAQKGDGDSLSKDLSEAGARQAQQNSQNKLSGQQLRDALSAIDEAGKDLGKGDQKDGGQSANGDQGGGQDNPSGGGANQEQNGGQDGKQDGGPNGGPQANSGDGSQQQDGGGSPSNGGQDGSGSKAGGSKPGQSAQAGAGGADSETGGGGSTNFHAPSGPGDHYQGRDIHGQGTFVKLYDEKLVGTKGQILKASGAINPLGQDAGQMDVLAQADKSDKSIVDYENARGAARAKAMDDLTKDQIPPQYRELIRNYYEK